MSDLNKLISNLKSTFPQAVINKQFNEANLSIYGNEIIKTLKKLKTSSQFKFLQLIDIAADAGADAVKFQSFSADRLAFKHTPKVKYQKKNSKKNESHYQMLKKLQFSEAQQLELINFCKKKNFLL